VNIALYIAFAILCVASLISLALTGISDTTHILLGCELAVAVRLVVGEVMFIKSLKY